MVVSKRFKYMFSLLSSVIKETIFKERLGDDIHQGEDQGCEYGGVELPSLSLPTQDGSVWGPASLQGREMK